MINFDDKEKEYFKTILCKNQEHLLRFCGEELESYRYSTIITDDYIYAEGDINILVVAHCDRKLNNDEDYTKIPEPVYTKEVSVRSYRENKYRVDLNAIFKYDKEVEVWSYDEKGIAGDDRCGVFLILELIKNGIRPNVLFTTYEENGSIGAKRFIDSEYIDLIKKNKFFVQIDKGHLTSESVNGYKLKRINNPYGRDLVFYDTTKKEFVDDISNLCKDLDFHKEDGCSTDIVHLTQATGIASVNISSGYFGEHLKTEKIVIEEVERAYEVLKRLVVFAKSSKKYPFK